MLADSIHISLEGGSVSVSVNGLSLVQAAVRKQAADVISWLPGETREPASDENFSIFLECESIDRAVGTGIEVGIRAAVGVQPCDVRHLQPADHG